MTANEIEVAVKARFDDLEEDIDVSVYEFFSDHNNEDRFNISVTFMGISRSYEVPINADDLAVENTIDAIDSAVRNQV